MSIEHLQELIRSCKTPIALQLNPDLERVSPKIRKNFTDLYGDCPMSRAETLRYHGSQLISLAAGKLPAVLLRADCYLRCGFMGMDVLSNLVNMAKNQGMYTIIDARTVYPDVWVGGEVNADEALTLLEATGCDGVMIGRGALGDPWLFAQVRAALLGEERPPEPTLNQRMTALRDQIYEMCEEKGEWAAMPQARSQAMHYMKGLHGAAALRRYCSMLEHFSDVDTLIEAVYRLQ